MSREADRPDEFEQHAQRVLNESVTRVSGHVRSRLNQARQAALAEIEARPRSFWRLPAIVPAAGAAAAAAVVAVVLMTHQGGERALPGTENGQTLEDIELLSDNDGLDLIENLDGSFYEWAAAEGDDGDSGASG
jgi:ferric-dicitrate binding protein FerR (iron transport regulator)